MEGLRQPEYVHVLINHLPLTGLFVALLGLLGSLALRNRPGVLASMGLVTLLSLSAWPVYVYGEAGYDRVYSMADDDGGAYLSRHKTLAERWIWLFYLTAATGALGVAVGWKRPKCLVAISCATALLAIASLVAGAIIADFGGKVRHPEFRHGPPPALNRQSVAGARALRFCGGATKPPNLACLRTPITTLLEIRSRC